LGWRVGALRRVRNRIATVSDCFPKASSSVGDRIGRDGVVSLGE